MLGEAEREDGEGSFSSASIPKRLAIVAAGAIVNIIFGLTVFFILICIAKHDVMFALKQTGLYIGDVFWLMSPFNFSANEAGVDLASSRGVLALTTVNMTYAVRPSVSLLPKTIVSGGDGTQNSPFTILPK